MLVFIRLQLLDCLKNQGKTVFTTEIHRGPLRFTLLFTKV